MPAGTVKFFNEQKGYGFIKPDEGGNDVFVHVSDLAPEMPLLAENMRVTYEIGSDRKTGKSKVVSVRMVQNDGR